jgi:hypothetical protein
MALTPWATHVLQWLVQWVAKSRDGANPTKTGPSSDWSLQFDSMKSESLVNAYQNGALNTFSGFVHTARHTKRVGNTRKLCTKAGMKVGSAIRVKS